MAENGAASGATEVTATVESSGPKGPSLSDLQAAFDRLSPEEKSQIAKIGMDLQGRIAADATAGRPAVEAPHAPVPQATPAPAAAPVEQASAPYRTPAPMGEPIPDLLPGNEPPPGFVSVPEAVYLWTAPASEGRPLWGLLAAGRKREKENPGRLVFKLLKAAYANTRAGKRIIVPAGGYVMVTLTDALESLLQLTEKDKDGHDRGCVAIWLRALGEMPVDGGGKVYGYDVRWESMPNAPGVPRFYPRELLTKAA